MYSILVVDDEIELRRQLVTILTDRGYLVEEACDGMEALKKLEKKQFPLILCDVRMPAMNGLELLRELQHREYSTALALITAHGNVREAIDAIREGAFDYIEKPIDENRILELVKKAERAYDMIHRISYSAPITPGEGKHCVGTSQSMKRVFQLVERLSRVNTSVLIRGENGTGKELVARAIHYSGPRKDGPFVAVNCAAIPESLIESELFGHEKGAFTGADQRKIGRFQYAAKGTLFLDEIGETSLATQVKLLRLLQEHAFTPVGSNREIKADVRIVAATNRNLEAAIQEGKFREDLFYRLNVMPIFLPPLRERKEDLTGLVQHFMEKYNIEYGAHITSIHPEALACLASFHWPGNIRELENAVEHAFVVETTNSIQYFSLPEYIRKTTKLLDSETASTSEPSTFTSSTLSTTSALASMSEPSLFPKETNPSNLAISSSPTEFSSIQSIQSVEFMDWEKGKEAFEKEFIVQALRTNKGKINLTAEQAKIPKNTLLRKIRKYAINPKDYSPSGSLGVDLDAAELDL